MSKNHLYYPNFHSFKLLFIIRIDVHKNPTRMEEISFTWRQFDAHSTHLFRTLFETKDFSDVTLVCDDQKQVKAHKFILSASSSILDDFLRNNKSEGPSIYLPGIRLHELEPILRFIYLGETRCFQDLISEVMSVAKYLKIKEFEVGRESDKSNFKKEDPLSQSTFEFGSKIIISNDMNEDPLSESTIEIDKKNKYEEPINLFCTICDKAYKKKNSFQDHIRSVHGGRKYYCKQCDYFTNRKYPLNRHVQQKHEGVRYICEICNYKAIDPRWLKVHIKKKHQVSNGNDL